MLDIKYTIKKILTKISPTLNTRIYYRHLFKKKLNLKNPRTLNEKTCWLKLYNYNHNPMVKRLADKYLVRDYVKEIGCENLLIPMLAAYDFPEEIEWEKLPEKFVLKLNVGSKANLICKNKSELNIEEALKTIKKWYSKENLERCYLTYGEMQYKGVKPKIIVEEFLEDREYGQLIDYKYFCVHGKAEYVMLCLNRFSDEGTSFYMYNKNWEFFPIDGQEDPKLEKPRGVDLGFAYADQLSKDFPFLRVDLYIVEGKVYFGELTFTGNGGCDNEMNPYIDIELGKKIQLTREGVEK